MKEKLQKMILSSLEESLVSEGIKVDKNIDLNSTILEKMDI